jgi:hypothetical protein
VKLLVLVALLASCGMKSQLRHQTTNPVFTEYINAFSDAHEKQIGYPIYTETVINFGDDSDFKGNVVGVCWYYELTGESEIFINKRYWNQVVDGYSEERKRRIIFHELGHCALRQDHREDGRNATAFSIMNSGTVTMMPFQPSAYRKCQSGFDRELFVGTTYVLEKCLRDNRIIP